MKSNRLSWDNMKDIEQLSDSLSEGKVSIGTSDTLLGLFAPLSKKGFKALNKMKQRFDKPYIILVGDYMKTKGFIRDGQMFQLEKIMKKAWPGPLTIIVPARKDLPSFMKSKQGTIALRVPDHPGLQRLLAHIPGFFSTSANKAGQPIAHTLDEVDQDIMDAIHYVITDDQQRLYADQPSTIIDATGDTIEVIREGAFPIDRLKKLINENH